VSPLEPPLENPCGEAPLEPDDDEPDDEPPSDDEDVDAVEGGTRLTLDAPDDAGAGESSGCRGRTRVYPRPSTARASPLGCTSGASPPPGAVPGTTMMPPPKKRGSNRP
jgi:hypothetical protein